MKKEDLSDIAKIASISIFKILAVLAILALALLFYDPSTKNIFLRTLSLAIKKILL